MHGGSHVGLFQVATRCSTDHNGGCHNGLWGQIFGQLPWQGEQELSIGFPGGGFLCIYDNDHDNNDGTMTQMSRYRSLRGMRGEKIPTNGLPFHCQAGKKVLAKELQLNPVWHLSNEVRDRWGLDSVSRARLEDNCNLSPTALQFSLSSTSLCVAS